MGAQRDRTLQAMGKGPSAGWPVFKVNVAGEDVVVDQNTFSYAERQLVKRELAKLGYEPDGEDRTFAAIWITMRRDDAGLTFADFSEQITAADYLGAETAEVSEDDSPEV